MGGGEGEGRFGSSVRGGNVKRFRGGLVGSYNCVSLNSRLESNKEEKSGATRVDERERDGSGGQGRS